MGMMVSANDLISMYMGIELQSLALYVLAAFNRDSLRASEAGLKYFVETFRGHDSRWVVSGLLLLVGADGYVTHGDFVRESLRHYEAVVRETALEIFLANEPGEAAVAAQCELSAKDACEAIVLLAKRKLSTL